VSGSTCSEERSARQYAELLANRTLAVIVREKITARTEILVFIVAPRKVVTLSVQWVLEYIFCVICVICGWSWPKKVQEIYPQIYADKAVDRKPNYKPLMLNVEQTTLSANFYATFDTGLK